jgi:hypothetical protein
MNGAKSLESRREVERLIQESYRRWHHVLSNAASRRGAGFASGFGHLDDHLGLPAHPVAHCCEGYGRPELGESRVKRCPILLMPRITVLWSELVEYRL